MRILKAVQAYYPFQEMGGPVVKVRAIALGLVQRGHSVTVLTPDWGFRPSLAQNMTSEKCRWGWRTEECGVEAIYFRNWARYHALTLNPGVISFAAGSLRNYSMVHVYGLYDLLGPAVGFFCRKRNVPYVVEPMGMFRPIIRNLGLKKLYHRLFGNSLLNCARRVIATSDQEKHELVDGGIDPARIVVRRNGIESPAVLPEPGSFRKKWGISPQAKLILYLGRMVEKKSPDLLLAAYARWRQGAPKGTNSILVMAGPAEGNGYSARLKALASSTGIADSVIFTAALYNDAKWGAYRDADVFVLPSQNENFGNSAAEAMACGTPVIVTDQCGIAPMVENKTGLVVRHEAGAVAGALRLLLGDANLADRFREGCAEAVRRLSWKEPLDQMEEVYRSALAEASQI